MEAHQIVKNKLKKLQIGQAQLAEMLNITQSSVSIALNGSNERTLFKIIGYLESIGEISLDEILNREKAATKEDLKRLEKKVDNILNYIRQQNTPPNET